MDNPEVVPVDRLTRVETRSGAARSFARRTTVDMLTVEQQVIGTALGSRGSGRAVVDRLAVDNELRRTSTLSTEQETMVRQLTTSGNGEDVMVGKAGAGKTHALAATHRCWQQAGVPVFGAAVAARAAVALGETTGIPTMSVARLLGGAAALAPP